MKTAAQLYEKEITEKGGVNYISNYQPMIEAIGEIVLQCDDKNYQGDSRILYKNGDKIGFLIFGWGSCLGCDALMACNSIDALESLFQDLINQTKWFDSKKEALEYFITKDWSLDYHFVYGESPKFIKEVIEYCSK